MADPTIPQRTLNIEDTSHLGDDLGLLSSTRHCGHQGCAVWVPEPPTCLGCTGDHRRGVCVRVRE